MSKAAELLKRKKGMVIVEARPNEKGDAVYWSDGLVTESKLFERDHWKPNPVAMSWTEIYPTNLMLRVRMLLSAPTTSWTSASGPALMMTDCYPLQEIEVVMDNKECTALR